MAQYNGTLQSIAGEVRAYKANSNKTQIYKDINARIRAVIDRRPFWSALMKRTVVSIPTAYTTGAINLTNGSTNIVGASTAWPVSDVVNTNINNGIREIGYQEVEPFLMTGIKVGTLLYVNDAGFSEVVAVTDVTNQTFTAEFRYLHNPNTVMTSSSLAGMQLKLGSFSATYTIQGIVSPTQAIIDTPFAGLDQTGLGYSLVKTYITIDPNLKDFLQVFDPVQNLELSTHVPQSYLNSQDPQRSATGNPQCLADYIPDAAGSMQYEIWPPQTSAYQIPVLYFAQWPELLRPTDKAPWFINPSVFVYGAVADALRRMDIKNPGDKDPYFNPPLANVFEAKFDMAAREAAAADESKALQSLEQQWQTRVSPGAAYWQSHAEPDDWGRGY